MKPHTGKIRSTCTQCHDGGVTIGQQAWRHKFPKDTYQNTGGVVWVYTNNWDDRVKGLKLVESRVFNGKITINDKGEVSLDRNAREYFPEFSSDGSWPSGF